MGRHLLIDESLCTGCGLCSSVCIRNGISVVGGKARENGSGSCFDCGQCFAVCPAGAITMATHPDATPERMAFRGPVAEPDELMGLLSERRSCRLFTPEPVSDEELSLLFQAARLSPTSQNSMDVEFVVVSDRLDGFRQMLADVLEPRSGEFPRIAQFVEHVRTGEGPDPFLWEGRQVILAFSEDPANACIAMSRIELMTQAMGLGQSLGSIVLLDLINMGNTYNPVTIQDVKAAISAIAQYISFDNGLTLYIENVEIQVDDCNIVYNFSESGALSGVELECGITATATSAANAGTMQITVGVEASYSGAEAQLADLNSNLVNVGYGETMPLGEYLDMIASMLA